MGILDNQLREWSRGDLTGVVDWVSPESFPLMVRGGMRDNISFFDSFFFFLTLLFTLVSLVSFPCFSQYPVQSSSLPPPPPSLPHIFPRWTRRLLGSKALFPT